MHKGKVHEGCKIECRLHGAFFDMKTGKVLSGPTSDDLPSFEVTEKDGKHFVIVQDPLPDKAY